MIPRKLLSSFARDCRLSLRERTCFRGAKDDNAPSTEEGGGAKVGEAKAAKGGGACGYGNRLRDFCTMVFFDRNSSATFAALHQARFRGSKGDDGGC